MTTKDDSSSTTRRKVPGILMAGAVMAIGAVACGSAPEGGAAGDDGEKIAMENQDLYVLSTVIWPNDSVPVCWETSGNSVSGTTLTTVQGYVKDAVLKAWGAASKVQFTGWANCPSTYFAGVRVVVQTGREHTVGIGTQLKGVSPGMYLDPALVNGVPDEGTIRTTAVHEFGHALGFAHEQNRPDTPADACTACTTTADCTVTDPTATCVNHQCVNSGNGDTLVGPWDLYSVMNYCNSAKSPQLSWYDAVGVQQFYGKPANVPATTANLAAVPVSSQVTGVAYVAPDGSVRFGTYDTSSWSLATTWTTIAAASTAPSGGGIAAAQRGTTGIVDVFYVGTNGALRVSSRSTSGSWSTVSTATSIAPAGARIATGKSTNHNLDAFFVGSDGNIKHVSDNSYTTVSNVTTSAIATAGAGITSMAEYLTGALDVFVVGTDGAVKMVQGDGNTWGGVNVLTATSFAPSGAPLNAGAVGGGDLDVFLVGSDGAVKTVYLSFGISWLTANLSATGYAPVRAEVASTQPSGGNSMQIYVARSDGTIYTASEQGNTGSWSAFSATAPTAIVASGAHLAAADGVIAPTNIGLGRLSLYAGAAWVGHGLF